MGNYKIVEVKI